MSRVDTDSNIADWNTKGLGRVKHELFTLRFGLRKLRRKGGCKRGTLEAKEGHAGVTRAEGGVHGARRPGGAGRSPGE